MVALLGIASTRLQPIMYGQLPATRRASEKPTSLLLACLEVRQWADNHAFSTQVQIPSKAFAASDPADQTPRSGQVAPLNRVLYQLVTLTATHKRPVWEQRR